MEALLVALVANADLELQVREAFGAKVRAMLIDALHARSDMTACSASWLSKYVVLLAFTAPDPTQQHGIAAAEAFMQCLAAWHTRLGAASAGAPHSASHGRASAASTARWRTAHAVSTAARAPVDEDDGEVGSGDASDMRLQPEYSLFFLLFLLAHHPDCPQPEELAQWREGVQPVPGHDEAAKSGGEASSGVVEERAQSRQVCSIVHADRAWPHSCMLHMP